MGVVSYSTDMFEEGDGLGQLYMLAFTNILADEHGVEVFNVKQKEAGEDWEMEFLAAADETKVMITMMSPRYFLSSACKSELKMALNPELDVFVIPSFIEKVDLQGLKWCGPTKEDAKMARYLRLKLLDKDWLPEPDAGKCGGNAPAAPAT